MNWKEYCKQYLMSAEDAVNHIQSGNRVVVTHTCSELSYLLDMMVANAKAYKDVETVHMVVMGKVEYCKPEYAGNFHHNTLFAGGVNRDAITEGQGDFTPSFLFEVSCRFSSTIPVGVAMAMVTPPDKNGMCSPGVSTGYTLEAVKQAKLAIAQINPQMPQTDPYSPTSVKDLDCIVEHEAPIIELKPPKIDDIEKAIGGHCASLVSDGAILQLGIGAILGTVLLFLKRREDLGIHSEMFSDGVVELAETSVITNAKKTLHPGKSEVVFLMDTRHLYDFVDYNPDVELRPVDYVNNPLVIVQNENMVSINSCVQMDLMGQVASESIGSKQISGVGGQVDFVRGASVSKGDVSIMAMSSTVKGKISKIVPLLDEDAAVITSRNDMDYIVTEYGVVVLKDQTLRQHARNLIEITHPDSRGEFKAGYEKHFHRKY